MRRREFVKVMASAAGAATLAGCQPQPSTGAAEAGRVLLVAFDGLDPRVIQDLMAAGRLPNFAKLAQQGSFTPLATTTPPHTPVAFSTVITGADANLHGVFDFIHRDPHPADPSLAVRPFFSTSEAIPPAADQAREFGDWRFPISGGKLQLLRRGQPFWDQLVKQGISADIYFVPANFPCLPAAGPGRLRAISGMGTPDLLGSYGEFTVYTSEQTVPEKVVSGGRFVSMQFADDRAETALRGPLDSTVAGEADAANAWLTQKLEILRDPVAQTALIRIDRARALLNIGQWSEWLPVEFTSQLPGASWLGKLGSPTIVRGMVKLFLRQVAPHFELYVSPINIDPAQPALPLSEPAEFATELAKRHGRFSTLGIPEDTKALTHGALDAEGFLSQAAGAMSERTAQWQAALSEFDAGCLFFYFGASDLLQHMFWREQDPRHPGYNAQEADKFGHVVADQYEQADARLGEALAAIGPHDTLFAFSDHGFTSFRQGFNLNSWLVEAGFMRLAKPTSLTRASSADQATEMFAGVDWAYTQAYGLGMNGLYLNLAGREKHGRVPAEQRATLIEELRQKLLAVKDSAGTSVIDRVDITAELYPGADPLLAPDLIIGYAEGFQASWDTLLGGLPQQLIVPNLERWSGTHLISARLIPGVLFSNRPVLKSDPHLRDLAPTVLSLFGIAPPAEMTGQTLLG